MNSKWKPIPTLILRISFMVVFLFWAALILMGILTRPDTFTHSELQIQEMELEYWRTKAVIVDEIRDFMNQVPYHNISPILVLKYADKHNVDLRLFLAQGLVESHYGTKGLARKTNSVCNVGAWDDGTITHKYDHPNESIEPYYKLLVKRYLVDKTEIDLLQNFVDKDGNRYASYPYYEADLTIVMNRINIQTKLDSLLNVYNYYKIELTR